VARLISRWKPRPTTQARSAHKKCHPCSNPQSVLSAIRHPPCSLRQASVRSSGSPITSRERQEHLLCLSLIGVFLPGGLESAVKTHISLPGLPGD